MIPSRTVSARILSQARKDGRVVRLGLHVYKIFGTAGFAVLRTA